MSIVSIKAKKVMACPGSWALVAEAEIMDGSGFLYVTAQEYDGAELTVSKQSLYSFLAENEGGPVAEFLEEYTTWKDAKGSAYADVFAKLKKALGMLG